MVIITKHLFSRSAVKKNAHNNNVVSSLTRRTRAERTESSFSFTIVLLSASLYRRIHRTVKIASGVPKGSPVRRCQHREVGRIALFSSTFSTTSERDAVQRDSIAMTTPIVVVQQFCSVFFLLVLFFLPGSENRSSGNNGAASGRCLNEG